MPSPQYYSSGQQNGGSGIILLALCIAIIVLFLVAILYTLYYLNLSNYQTYGSEWNYVAVSDNTTYIKPYGHSIYSANGNSSTRGSNPDYLLIKKPCSGIYEKIPFIIYNNSNQGNLTLNFDSEITINNTPSPYIIGQQSGVWFIWTNSTTLTPLVAGTTYQF